MEIKDYSAEEPIMITPYPCLRFRKEYNSTQNGGNNSNCLNNNNFFNRSAGFNTQICYDSQYSHLAIDLHNGNEIIKNIPSNLSQIKKAVDSYLKLSKTQIYSFKPRLEKLSSINNSKTVKVHQNISVQKSSSNSSTANENGGTVALLTVSIKRCFICASISNNFNKIKLYSTGQCDHYFCNKCGKNYYEEKIENRTFSFDCPKYTCERQISMEIMQKLISPLHFEKLQREMNSDNRECLNFDETTKLSYNNYLLDTHVISIVRRESDCFENYIRLKNITCFSCKLPSLFGKIYRDYAKCLNCNQIICKYCLKKFDDNHLNIRSTTHCKVFFRSKKRRRKKINYSGILEFLLFLVGYLVLIVGCTKYISGLFSKCLKIKVIFHLINFTIFLIMFFLLLIIFPYYPIIVFLFEYKA